MASILKGNVQETMDSARRAMTSDNDVMQEPVSVLASISAPVAGGLIGWYTSYVIGQKLEGRELIRRDMAGSVLPQAEVAGWVLSGTAAASIAGAAILRIMGRHTDALFVGQWAPTFVGLAVLARVFGHRSLVTGGPIEPVSWGLVGAGLASVLSSAAMHLRNERRDGLFVGQWAPTLVGAGVLTRLFGELRNK